MEKLNEILGKIEKINYSLTTKTQKRLDNLTKPPGSLGQLEELAKQVVEITKDKNPSTKNKVIFTMVGDHGITEEGVSAFPKEVTSQMVYNFLKGGAAINVLAKHIGARTVVVDMGIAEKLELESLDIKRVSSQFTFVDKKVGLGTKNMIKGPAMSKQQAIRAIENGIEVFEKEYKKGIDIVGLGDMGIGNTTASSAITSVITGESVENVTGRGTGINDRTFNHKIKVIKKIIEINAPEINNVINILSTVGGFEIGGIVGVILASASKRVPVIIDGFISGAAALIAYELKQEVKDYMIAAHCSVERGHKAILDYIGLKPLLDLDLRLGEGTGAVLSMNIIEAGVKILTEMATFQNADISEKIDKKEESI